MEGKNTASAGEAAQNPKNNLVVGGSGRIARQGNIEKKWKQLELPMFLHIT